MGDSSYTLGIQGFWQYALAKPFSDRFTLVVAFGARGFIGERLLYSVVGASGPVGDLSNRRQEILVK